ncbi:hypothetical protein BHE74_00036770 [Ensete ventricosum]|nr:hypothetical protein BHE74_00036770 [Ensete ventricosum]
MEARGLGIKGTLGLRHQGAGGRWVCTPHPSTLSTAYAIASSNPLLSVRGTVLGNPSVGLACMVICLPLANTKAILYGRKDPLTRKTIDHSFELLIVKHPP